MQKSFSLANLSYKDQQADKSGFHCPAGCRKSQPFPSFRFDMSNFRLSKMLFRWMISRRYSLLSRLRETTDGSFPHRRPC